MLPMMFSENLFDDLFNDAFGRTMWNTDKALYGKNAARIMKTDVHETEDSYELAVDLPGFKKDEIGIELKDGYLTITASKGVDKEEEDKKITWLVPDAQRNSMEPILLELQPGARSNELPPLESEEFGYVLHGQVNLVAGKRTYRVRKGFSFCLHPNTTHYLENTGAHPAVILWISTPPSF